MLPDFKGVSNFDDIQKRFKESARQIMLGCDLEYEDGRRWRITALELYLRLNKRPDVWLDPYTDEDEEQLNSGSWYIRQKKGPGYWRIDITAGSRDENIHAGLLIRQLDRQNGPAYALHKIVLGHFQRQRWLDEEKQRAQKLHGTSIRAGHLKLVRHSRPTEGDIWIGPRIGLSKKHDDQFRRAPLRISTWKMDEHMQRAP